MWLPAFHCNVDKAEEVMLPPRPLVGGGAWLKVMSAARPSPGLRFKHSAQVVWVGGGQVYDRQAGPGNSRPGLGWLDNFLKKPQYSIDQPSQRACTAPVS